MEGTKMAGRPPKGSQTPEEIAAKKAEREATKQANFKKLAERRVSIALDAIANVGGLANRNSYSYTSEQASAIGNALDQMLVKTMAKFAPEAKIEAKGGFSLDDAVAAIKTETEEVPAE